MEYHQLFTSFGILNRTFVRYVSNAISEKDISYSDSIFLVNIGNDEGTNQEEIANHLAIDTAAVARSVKNMEKKGFIRAEYSRNDKRVKELYLTESGRGLYHFMQQLNQSWIDSVLGDLDTDEISDFVRILNCISGRAKTITKFG